MNEKIRQFSIIAVLIALTISIGSFIHIPIPSVNGEISLIDIGINAAAVAFGPTAGVLVGAIGSGASDLFTGFAQWAPFSILIHGLQGYVVGKLIWQKNIQQTRFLLAALIIGELIVNIGYFFASIVLFDLKIALASIPINLFQGIVGIVIPLMLKRLFVKDNYFLDK